MKKEKTYLTEEGYKEIKDKLNILINEKRPANIKALKEARALGDLSENADYHAAREEQAEIESEVKRLEKLLDNVEIIEKKDNGKVGLGSTVEIEYVDDKEKDKYVIVGSQEADPFLSKISFESPIAKAILNKKVGDIVEVESPNGTYQVKVTQIS